MGIDVGGGQIGGGKVLNYHPPAFSLFLLFFFKNAHTLDFSSLALHAVLPISACRPCKAPRFSARPPARPNGYRCRRRAAACARFFPRAAERRRQTIR